MDLKFVLLVVTSFFTLAIHGQETITSSSPTTSIPASASLALPAASTAPANCSETLPGTNTSVCWFTLGDVPSCARECLQNITLAEIPCQTTDLACFCAHSSTIQSAVVPCISLSCSVNQISQVVNYYYGLCNVNHLPLQGATTSSTSPTSSASSTSSVVPITVQVSTSSPIATAQSFPDNGGMATATKAAIAIGVVFGVVLLAGLAAYFCLRRKGRTKEYRQNYPQNLIFGQPWSSTDRRREPSATTLFDPPVDPQEKPLPIPGELQGSDSQMHRTVSPNCSSHRYPSEGYFDWSGDKSEATTTVHPLHQSPNFPKDWTIKGGRDPPIELEGNEH